MPILYIKEKQRNKDLPYIKKEKELDQVLSAPQEFVVHADSKQSQKLAPYAADKNIYVVLKPTKKDYKDLDDFIKKSKKKNSSLKARQSRKQAALPKMDNYSLSLESFTDNYQLPNFNDRVKKEVSFQEYLFSLIRDLQLTDVEVYQRSNIDRKLFSKIRKESYTPSKKSVLALCIGLGLNMSQADKLLMKVGYCFADNDVRDVIIQYCIIKKIYNIYEVNEILYKYDQETL